MNFDFNEFEIFIPPMPDIENALHFVSTLHSCPTANWYRFNFKDFQWTRPFSLLFLSNQIRKFRESRRSHGSKFTAFNFEHATYAAHMGFFQVLGMDFGKKPGDAHGSNTYLPITYLYMDDIESEARKEVTLPQNVIEKYARKLAAIVIQKDSGTLFDIVSYSIREIFRNTYEHSTSTYLAFVAQFWPKKGEVEIAILDDGVGLKNTLSKNPFLEIESDRAALNLALLPGISGKMYKGKKRDYDNPWENSGYGLYMTSRLSREKGSFFIASGENGLFLKKGAKRYLETGYQGTIIRMVLAKSDQESLKKLLTKYEEEAREIALSYLNGEMISASSASRMVTEDFKKNDEK